MGYPRKELGEFSRISDESVRRLSSGALRPVRRGRQRYLHSGEIQDVPRTKLDQKPLTESKKNETLRVRDVAAMGGLIMVSALLTVADAKSDADKVVNLVVALVPAVGSIAYGAYRLYRICNSD